MGNLRSPRELVNSSYGASMAPRDILNEEIRAFRRHG